MTEKVLKEYVVLIVEDDKQLNKLIQRILTKEGFKEIPEEEIKKRMEKFAK